MLGVVAALATIMPARADVFLTFNSLLSPPATPTTAIPNNLGTGNINPTPLTSLTMNPGEVRYVAICLNANAVGVTPNDWQSQWNQIDPFATHPGAGLTGTGMNITFNPTVADNPMTTGAAQNANFRVQTAGVGYSAASLQTPPAGLRQYGTLTTDGLYLGANAVDGSNPPDFSLNPTPLLVFKIVGGAAGTTNYTLSPLTQNANPNGSVQPIFQWVDVERQTNAFGESTVFGGTHVTYQLPVTVVPEPSSMCLAGLAFAGLGYRKIRRKFAK